MIEFIKSLFVRKKEPQSTPKKVLEKLDIQTHFKKVLFDSKKKTKGKKCLNK